MTPAPAAEPSIGPAVTALLTAMVAELVRGPEGKLAYVPVLEILGGREVRDAFSAACISAILAFDPTAFDIIETEPD